MKKTSQHMALFLYPDMRVFMNDNMARKTDLCNDLNCGELRLFWLNQGKPLHLIPWIAPRSRSRTSLKSGGISLNRIIRIFVEVILRRWDLRIPGPDRAPLRYTRKPVLQLCTAHIPIVRVRRTSRSRTGLGTGRAG